MVAAAGRRGLAVAPRIPAGRCSMFGDGGRGSWVEERGSNGEGAMMMLGAGHRGCTRDGWPSTAVEGTLTQGLSSEARSDSNP